MSDIESVSAWIAGLRAGDALAAQKVWERFHQQVLNKAHYKLGNLPRRAFDASDVAQSAFHSFVRGCEAGRFSRLEDRDDLWTLLAMLTERKANAARDRHLAQKRGGGQLRGESAFERVDQDSFHAGIAHQPGPDVSPEFVQTMCEVFTQRLESLTDDTQRQIALLKLECYTNQEIAEKLDISLRSVERKLGLIRAKWQTGEPNESS